MANLHSNTAREGSFDASSDINFHSSETEDERMKSPKTSSIWPASTCSASTIQPTERTNSKTPARLNHFEKLILKNRWLWESLAALFSVACISIVAIILETADGSKLSAWAYPISPNALVSIFSTLSKAALMVPVASCIGQVKWIYFENPHPVYALELFDDASRGPWGSLALMWKMRLKPTAVLAVWGCFITILAVAFDPFTQQLLSFPSKAALDTTTFPLATLGSTHAFDSGQTYSIQTNADPFIVVDEEDQPKAPQPMQVAVFSGLMDQDFTPKFTCPSSDCRWPKQESLAVCSQCADVTQSTKRICTSGPARYNCSFTTPSDFLLNDNDISLPGVPNYEDVNRLSSVARFPGNASHKGNPPDLVKFAILNMTSGYNLVASSNDSRYNPPIFECTLSLCAKTFYDTRVVNGTIKTQLTEETAFAPSGSNNFAIDMSTGQTSRLDRRYVVTAWKFYDVFTIRDTTNKSTSNRNFTVNAQDRRAMGLFLQDLFTMNMNKNQLGVRDLLWSTNDIPGKIQNVSVSLTNALRQFNSTNAGNGDIYRTDSYIHVQWPWAILPGSLVVMAVLFLIVSVWQSSRHRAVPWKNSTLPLVMSHLEGWDEGELAVVGPEQLERATKGLTARVDCIESEGYMRFVREKDYGRNEKDEAVGLMA